MSRSARPTSSPRERAIVCGVVLGSSSDHVDDDIVEARGLVQAAGAEVVGDPILQRRHSPDAATLFGRGKVDELAADIRRLHPDLVVVDNDLTPAQARNLEKAWNTRVVDRSELILDIFARRARTRQARLQVELAQNEYLAPRLRRMWTHLERMEGAIGTRGPGETQLETDKRLLKTRIQDLRAELKEIEARKLREVSARAGVFSVGLVGYTNAGKSTLLNKLTGADEFVADMLFATLDTRTRKWRLRDGRTVLLSDTVGFLRRLPHHLVASFHATLEETLNADLLLHVVDASHPNAPAQMAAVEEVLSGLSRNTRTGIVVFNKIDRVPDPIGLRTLGAGLRAPVAYVSAMTNEGLDELDAMVARILDARSHVVDVYLAPQDGKLHHLILGIGTPQEEELMEDGVRRLRIRLTDQGLGSIRTMSANLARLVIVEPAHDATMHAPSVRLEDDRLGRLSRG